MDMFPALSFAPVSAENAEADEERFLTESIRWSAPVELGNQYVYVSATTAGSVLIVVSTPPGREGDPVDDPISIRLELAQVALRGTIFTWRVAHNLGRIEDLIERFGRDYEVAVVVSTDSGS
jgi:hypothetical protein